MGYFAPAAKKGVKGAKAVKKTAYSTWDTLPPQPPTILEELQNTKRPDRNSGSLHHQEQQRWADFSAMEYPTGLQEDIAEARANHEVCEDYTEVFLSHAQMYVFADRYSVENLRRLTLRRLHETLVKFTLYDVRVPDITALLAFSYATTPRIGLEWWTSSAHW